MDCFQKNKKVWLAQLKTILPKAHKNCHKKIEHPSWFHDSIPCSVVKHSKHYDREKEVNENILTSYIRTLPKDSHSVNSYVDASLLPKLRRAHSMYDINDNRNMYLNEIEPNLLENSLATTDWPVDPELLKHADQFIHNVLSLSSDKKAAERVLTVGNHYVEVGVIYGPERFYVTFNSSNHEELNDSIHSFNHARFKSPEIRLNEVNLASIRTCLLAYCEHDEILKRVYCLSTSHYDELALYDFDTGEVAIFEDGTDLSIKKLPSELCTSLPVYTPARLINQVTQDDFARYINHIRKTGLIYIVGFNGAEILAAATTDVAVPNPMQRFCNYLYCEGDCYLHFEQHKNKRET